MQDALIFSCEHGGNDVPPDHAALFVGHEALLPTHRGWDPGALLLAQEMAARFDAPLFYSTTTRLLVDLNRSVGHKQLHSEATRALPLAQRRAIVAQHYQPHRDAVESEVARCIGAGQRVIHIASHSFTPVLHGVERQADVACLYNTQRPGERAFAAQWLGALGQRRPDLRLRRNYPYNGKGDGLSSTLRKRHGQDVYVSIELEVNQRFMEAGGPPWDAVRGDVLAALAQALGR